MMSLKFVTKKFEDHTLEEGEGISQKESPVDDSGTESDDETEKDDVADNDSEDGDINLDSGVSLNLRSHVSGSRGGRTRVLPMMTRQQSAPEPAPATVANCGLLDDTDNHSSEEELEDIIGDKKVYGGMTTVTGAGGGIVSIKSGMARCNSTNPEKRKWSEVNSSGDETMGTSGCVFRAGSGSSGDEEVSGLMDTGASYTPVQFCTSPPLDVYKPRKSQSPPPKLFHMSSSNGHSGPVRQHSFDSSKTRGEAGHRPAAGAFLPRPRPRLMRPVEFSSLSVPGSAGGQDTVGDGDDGQDSGDHETSSGHRSPSKRHRTTPIQRPCLDFEKMQQIKTKVVTSWRQGTELSLFCW